MKEIERDKRERRKNSPSKVGIIRRGKDPREDERGEKEKSRMGKVCRVDFYYSLSRISTFVLSYLYCYLFASHFFYLFPCVSYLHVSRIYMYAFMYVCVHDRSGARSHGFFLCSRHHRQRPFVPSSLACTTALQCMYVCMYHQTAHTL